MNLIPKSAVKWNIIGLAQVRETEFDDSITCPMKNINKQLVIIVFSCSLLACASTESTHSDVPATAAAGRSDCISKAAIRDYRVLDEANLIVSEGASRKYHVALSRRAFGLRSSHAIGFESNSSRVCGPFDDVVFNNGLGPEKVSIATIRRLTPEQEDELLIRFGKREPENEQPRRQEEVEGAEVEELD